MADMSTVPGTAIAFSEFNPAHSKPPFNELAALPGGILRALPFHHDVLMLPAGQSHFGYVENGSLRVHINNLMLVVPSGFYFCLPGSAEVKNDGGVGIVISRPGYQGFLQMGLIENQGRLRYINGCTDSLLIPPIKLGDPCLNLLYFPPNIDQTMHTHPSDRIGMILSGRGQCITDDERGRVVTPLEEGMLFCIHTGGQHKFKTYRTAMRVLAYHPDSDFGPTDEDHPMINRTMVGGISAKDLPALHTRKE